MTGGQGVGLVAGEVRAVDGNVAECGSDGRVVLARVRKRTPCQIEAKRDGRAAVAVQFVDDARVVVGRHDDEHIAKVLGRRADEARPADVDLLDEIVEPNVRLGRSRHERVEIDGHEIDQADVVRRRGLEILGVMAPRENAAVDLGMEGLDAAVHHLGKAGDVRDIDDGEAGVCEGARGSAGRDELEPAIVKRVGKRQKT